MKSSLRALALVGALSIASWVQAEPLKYRTIIFFGAEDTDMVLNCLPEHIWPLVHFDVQVFTNRQTWEVETYHIVHFPDKDVARYTAADCQDLLTRGCSALCPLE